MNCWSRAAAPCLLLASTVLGTTSAWSGPGWAPDSPLKLTDIYSNPKFRDLEISPDGNHFAGIAVADDGRTMLHVLERKTMSIVHTEAYSGSLGIGGIEWHDKDHLLVTSTYKSEVQEGFGSMGVFLLDIRSGDIRRIWGGEGTSDYGGYEGAQIGGRIDDQHYWLTVGPSGSTYSEVPFVYLYKLNIFTGRATRVLKSPSRGAEFVFNADDEVTHAVGMLPDDFDSVVVHRRVNGEWVLEGIYDNKKGVSVPRYWHKEDPDRILYIDNRDAPTTGYYWVNAKTGDKTLIYRHPKVDAEGLFFNEDGEAVAAQHSYDYPSVVMLKSEDRAAQRLKKVAAVFPNASVTISSSTEDGIEHVLTVGSDQERGQFYLWNEYDGKIRHLLDPKPQVKAKDVAKTHAVNFKARDGMELVAYLTVPNHKEMKQLPLVVLPHGGPHGPRDYWDYYSEAVAFANAGYAVLRINYRGSGGYGRDFQYRWYRHWGLEMQDDLEDGVLWAAQAGIVDIDRVCIYGASYGGYAALMGVVKTPDRYRCAIGYVGVFDLNLMRKLGDVSRSKGGQKYLDEALGTDPVDLAARSSTPNVDRIKVPVLLVHGMQDDRAHYQHYVEMREALKAKNHRFETLRVPRAGHGARDIESQLEVSCRMIDFLDRHIGTGKPGDKPNDCRFPGSKELPYEYFEGK